MRWICPFSAADVAIWAVGNEERARLSCVAICEMNWFSVYPVPYLFKNKSILDLVSLLREDEGPAIENCLE
jgi:hypothetical protein